MLFYQLRSKVSVPGETCWSLCGLICQLPQYLDVPHILIPKLESLCLKYRARKDIRDSPPRLKSGIEYMNNILFGQTSC